jgi:16S rRNA pseudouridine516 synthase
MRVDKLLVNLKYGSRKMIHTMIKRKRISVNDEIITKLDFKVDENKDQIKVDDEIVFYRDKVVLMVNKPKDYVSANKDGLHKTVFELIGEPYNRFDLNIAGRLDIDTEGLIILTNDGEYLHSLISPKKDVYKKYYVETLNSMDPTKLLQKYEILDGKNCLYTPLTAKVEKLDSNSFYLYIKEGKYHQVKRMVEHFRNEVTYLKRLAIGDIVLDESLKLGEYKEI